MKKLHCKYSGRLNWQILLFPKLRGFDTCIHEHSIAILGYMKNFIFVKKNYGFNTSYNI